MGRYLSGYGALPGSPSEESMMGRPVLILLMTFPLFNGCWQLSFDSDQAAVAVVNQESITVKELFSVLERRETKEGKTGEVEKGEREDGAISERQILARRLLQQLIDRRMLLQEARRLKIHLGSNAIANKQTELKEGQSEEGFLQSLEDREMTLLDWEQSLEENLLIEKLFDQLANEDFSQSISVSEESIRDYYNDHAEEWAFDDRLKLRQIIVDTEAEAEAVQLLLSNRADFSETARLHSKLGDAGDLGYLSRRESPVQFEALFNAEVGFISEIIKTPFGYHLVKVEDRQAAGTFPYEEVRERIHQNMINEKREQLFSKWFKALQLRTEVRINEDLLRKVI